MYDSDSSASSTCREDEVYDQSLLDLDVDLCGLHMADENDVENDDKHAKEDQKVGQGFKEFMGMLAEDLTSEEKESYGALLNKYPKLFVNDYS